MSQERIKLAIAADTKSLAVVKDSLEGLTAATNLEVVRVNQISKAQIKQIQRKNPDVVLVHSALLNFDVEKQRFLKKHEKDKRLKNKVEGMRVLNQEYKVLVGFVGRLERKCPEAKLVIQTPRLPEKLQDNLLEAGADLWVDERTAPEKLGQVLNSLY